MSAAEMRAMLGDVLFYLNEIDVDNPNLRPRTVRRSVIPARSILRKVMDGLADYFPEEGVR